LELGAAIKFIFMKRLNWFLVCGIMATMFLVTGCDSDEVEQRGTFVSLDENTLNLGFGGGEQTVTVSSDGRWDVSGITEWLTVSPQSNNGNATVNITITKNELFAERVAVLTFRGGAGIDDAIRITQEGRVLSDTITGVVINNVRWATRNVNTPGTFADRPEHLGMLYQWGRGVGYAATGEIENWFDGEIETETWVNDPCPPGWRVPTGDELETLRDTNSLWLDKDGVNGRAFTDRVTGNVIFLPAVGWRNEENGGLANAGLYGLYWANSNQQRLFFTNAGTAVLSESNLLEGFSVRCVAEEE